MPWVRTQSFARGELAPEFNIRDDLSKVYPHGLRRARNGRIRRGGAFESRPGTTLVRTLGVIHDGDDVATVPFRYSDTDALMLVLYRAAGIFYILVIKNGVHIHTIDQPDVSWADADLLKFRVKQVGNVLNFVHRDAKPYDLVRTDDTSWSWVPFTLERRPLISTPSILDRATGAAGRTWLYYVSAILERDGLSEETLAVLVTRKKAAGPVYSAITDNNWLVNAANPIEIDFTPVLADIPAGFRLKAWTVWKGRGDVVGFLGQQTMDATAGGGNVMRDTGEDPIYNLRPPFGFSPFKVWQTGLFTKVLLRTELPIANAYFQQRYALAGTAQRQGRVWFSATDSFLDFERLDPGDRQEKLAKDAIELQLVQYEFEEMRAMVGVGSLLVFTSSAVYSVRGADDFLSPVGLPVIEVRSKVGSDWLEPLVVPNAVLYVAARNLGVRGLVYDINQQGYVDTDLTFYARHLVDGHSFRSWCLEERSGYIHAVRDDGVWLTLTHSHEQGLTGWTWSDTQGEMLAIGCIPEGDEDAVYTVVRRSPPAGPATFCIERFSSRNIARVEDAICLDSAAVHDGSPTNTLAGLGHLEGAAVYALSDGYVSGPHVVAGGQITVPGTPKSRIVAGLAYEPQLELLDVGSGEWKTTPFVVKECRVEYEASGGIFGSETETGDPIPLRRSTENVGVGSWAASPLETGYGTVRISGRYGKGGRCFIRQTAPLPMRILSVARLLVEGNPS
jgi:hypothetical protein